MAKNPGLIDLHEHRKLWEEVLDVCAFDESADFFALGGHSLLAIELIEKIETTFSVNVSFKDFIENPNLDKLHDLILKKEFRPRSVTNTDFEQSLEILMRLKTIRQSLLI